MIVIEEAPHRSLSFETAGIMQCEFCNHKNGALLVVPFRLPINILQDKIDKLVCESCKKSSMSNQTNKGLGK